MSKDFELEAEEVLGIGPLLYGDFMVANTDNKIYEEITDIVKVNNYLTEVSEVTIYRGVLISGVEIEEFHCI